MRFHVCDSLTNRIIGQLHPSKWEITDPLRAPGIGTLTVPLPTGEEAVRALVNLTLPRRRWVAVEYDRGRFLFGGPIPRRPARSGGEVIIPLVDWRSWFYRAYLRPTTAGVRTQYVAKAADQGKVMRDLMSLALTQNAIGAPRITIDAAPDTGIDRDLTALQLDRSIGEHLDTIMNRERGSEWHTYVATTTDPAFLVPHVAVAYPERRLRDSVIRVEYKIGTGGNAHDYSWPEGQDAATRVWATGDGEPPDQAYAVDEYPELEEGNDVLWEDIIGPLDGVSRNSTAFEYAFAQITRSRGYEGTAEFSIADEKLPLANVSTGDRARVILEDGWDAADVAAARIVSRTMSGGRGQPTIQRLSIDLADDGYTDLADPGTAVDEDEE